MNAIVRLPHPRSGVLKPPSLPINPKAKGIEQQQDEMVSHMYTNLPVNAIVEVSNSLHLNIDKGNSIKYKA